MTCYKYYEQTNNYYIMSFSENQFFVQLNSFKIWFKVRDLNLFSLIVNNKCTLLSILKILEYWRHSTREKKIFKKKTTIEH